MGWIAFVLFITFFFFGSGVGGGRMPCCGRPHAVPGSWNSGTHLRLPGAGPEGRSVSPRPGDPFPSSLRLFGVLGSILSEGRKAFADFEPPPPPSKPRRTWEVPRVTEVRLGGTGREKLAGGGTTRTRSPSPFSGTKKPARVSPGRVEPGRAAVPREGNPSPNRVGGRWEVGEHRSSSLGREGRMGFGGSL